MINKFDYSAQKKGLIFWWEGSGKILYSEPPWLAPEHLPWPRGKWDTSPSPQWRPACGIPLPVFQEPCHRQMRTSLNTISSVWWCREIETEMMTQTDCDTGTWSCSPQNLHQISQDFHEKLVQTWSWCPSPTATACWILVLHSFSGLCPHPNEGNMGYICSTHRCDLKIPSGHHGLPDISSKKIPASTWCVHRWHQIHRTITGNVHWSGS